MHQMICASLTFKSQAITPLLQMIRVNYGAGVITKITGLDLERALAIKMNNVEN